MGELGGFGICMIWRLMWMDVKICTLLGREGGGGMIYRICVPSYVLCINDLIIWKMYARLNVQ